MNAATVTWWRGLFPKYLAVMAGMACAVSLTGGLIAIWFSYKDHKASLFALQHEQAEAAAAKIGQFVKEIESHLGWMVQMPTAAMSPEAHRIDALRLLRQAPAITELTMLDESNREQLRISRLALDVIGSGIDRSNEPLVLEVRRHKVFYGPVYLQQESEPHMTLALAGPRPGEGIAIAKVNLKFIWDVVSQIRVGESGVAYVVNAEGRLIAHPDISLVLRNSDFSNLPQVRAARGGDAMQPNTTDAQGKPVLAAYAAIAPVGWLVLIERPAQEAFAPVYSSLLATGSVLLAALIFAIIASILMARRLVNPIRALQAGAAEIGAGALDHRIAIRTGDELEALGNQFNRMSEQLQDSYATLERKVEERTQQLALANLAKSRFLAAASHDLRQPLHALNLFVAELRAAQSQAERGRLAGRIDDAVTAMNRLFNALLDISRLDAGVLTPDRSDFPVTPLLRRVEATFARAAEEKGLRLRVVPSAAWVRTDAILLERILLNLVSNAVRYTARGGVVIGCRRAGGQLRIEVWDSGIGIAPDQQRDVFSEFFQISGNGTNEGLGLGLAIVARLGALLDHPVTLRSTPQKGSRFAVAVPLAAARSGTEQAAPAAIPNLLGGRRVLVIDDDALVRDGMAGLLQSWGCAVVVAASDHEAIAALTGVAPELIASDLRLRDGRTGIEAIAHLREHFDVEIPAFLISGDTSPEGLQEARARGFHLLHKPVAAMTLRAMLSRFLKNSPASASASPQPRAFGADPVGERARRIPH